MTNGGDQHEEEIREKEVLKETIDARRKVKGAIAELSIVLSILDKRLKR